MYPLNRTKSWSFDVKVKTCVSLSVIISNDTGESVWWRGCTTLNDQKLGCTERKWNHTGKEILIDECICDDDLCNEDMKQFSTEKTTTIHGRS